MTDFKRPADLVPPELHPDPSRAGHVALIEHRSYSMNVNASVEHISETLAQSRKDVAEIAVVKGPASIARATVVAALGGLCLPLIAIPTAGKWMAWPVEVTFAATCAVPVVIIGLALASPQVARAFDPLMKVLAAGLAKWLGVEPPKS